MDVRYYWCTKMDPNVLQMSNYYMRYQHVHGIYLCYHNSVKYEFVVMNEVGVCLETQFQN